jgi:hypothetical protein
MVLMVTPEGLALIIELVAGIFLVAGVAGFGFRRTAPWLVVSALAFAALIVTVSIVVESSS